MFKLTHRQLKISLVLVSVGLLASANAATQGGVSTVLPGGVVACLSLKDAKNYALYSKQAPDFAKDLLNRAACFQAEQNREAVFISQSAGYTKMKLITGHTVWVPSRLVTAVAK